ncbi:UNVERIFIED_CONTAM: hypothetical protein Sradi_6418300 [Sesamum radiatum]|uniref:Uncharacterized protein n=1 Tax=Sesamum radiatum TaxID=300843 RepID=A0AAW2K383_SESRA
MAISFIENGFFLLKTFHAINCDRGLLKSLITLAQVAENENPVEVDLTWCGFHVRIHGLPIGKMTLDIARFIGDKIGRLHTFDQAKGLESWGSFMRLRMAIDITKPLPWALKI